MPGDSHFIDRGLLLKQIVMTCRVFRTDRQSVQPESVTYVLTPQAGFERATLRLTGLFSGEGHQPSPIHPNRSRYVLTYRLVGIVDSREWFADKDQQ